MGHKPILAFGQSKVILDGDFLPVVSTSDRSSFEAITRGGLISLSFYCCADDRALLVGSYSL